LDWTLLVLSGLERIADELAIRVVVGPLFDRVVRAKLSVAAAVSHHHMEIVDIPESLAKQMQWCDVAVAASGLTKYELAASGTPTVLFSIDAHHDASNSAFAALDITEDLGASPTPERIADATRALLLDRERRERMAQMGQRLIDGKGAERLILKLKERSPEK
jgi:spore coat polysaccharide biosynthesis predicted glycosyltransferase SpsG